jgi:hypothetical protein
MHQPKIKLMQYLKVAIIRKIAPCSPCMNQHFTGMCRPKMEAILPSETLVHVVTTRRCIPVYGNCHNYCCENLKSSLFIVSIELNHASSVM